MSKRHQCFRLSILLCWMLFTCGLGMVVPHTVAHAAAALPPGYSLTVTESASTMTYGGTPPNFQAQLTVPAGENPVRNPALFNFKIDSQNYGWDGYTSSGDTYTFILKGRSVATIPPLPAGQHTVVATYDSIPLQETLESAPITLTVKKLTPSLDCEIHFLPTYAVNASITFTLSAQNGPDVDWQDATYTMTFIGSQTFTDTHLTADSSGDVTASAPPVPGKYKFRCTFNGTANFNAASVVGSSTVVVSANHHPTIKLYSNPTTIKGGQTVTLDIVVAGASGLPTPTGQVGLNMGGILFTRPITLGPGGSVEFQIAFPPNPPGKTLGVNYSGDTVYATTFASFPLTNPAIPGGSNPSNPKPTPKPTSTATPTPAGGSTPAPSNITTTNNGTTSGSDPTNATSNQGNTVFWIGLLGLLVLVAFGSGVFIVLRKRARAASTSATTTFPFWEDD